MCFLCVCLSFEASGWVRMLTAFCIFADLGLNCKDEKVTESFLQ